MKIRTPILVVAVDKNTIVTQVVCFQMFEFDSSVEVSNSMQYYFNEKLLLSEKLCLTSEGAVSHNVSTGFVSTALHC